MGSFIARQPNGLLCRFSSVVDTITDYNMTDEEYIEMCAEKAREKAKEVLKYHILPFSCVKEQFVPNNMSNKEFKQIIKKWRHQENEKSILLHCICIAFALQLQKLSLQRQPIFPSYNREGKTHFRSFTIAKKYWSKT